MTRFFCNTLLNVLSRLAEAEFNLSQLHSRLEEERSRREAAEEAMRLTEQRVVRYKRKAFFFFFLVFDTECMEFVILKTVLDYFVEVRV